MEESFKAFIMEHVAGFDPSDIKGSSGRLRAALAALARMNEAARLTLSGLLKIVTDSCEHRDAKTGSNGRDGSWMNSCPHCGHSY